MLKRYMVCLFLLLVFIVVHPIKAFSISGDVWLEPLNVYTLGSQAVGLYIDTGSMKIGTYQLAVQFDPSLVSIDISKGNQGAEAGINGFISAVNTDNRKGEMKINGFKAEGTGPGNDLQLLVIYFNEFNKTDLDGISIIINDLTDENGKSILK